jgi:hypothetical protein
MKINAKITMLFDDGGLNLRLEDDDANVTFVELRLNPQQVCQVFSRLCYTSVESCEVFGLDKVGKKMENKKFEFVLPDDTVSYRDREIVKKIAEKICPEGWELDLYFDSQGSFFKRDGKQYARCTIRRWVEKEQGK